VPLQAHTHGPGPYLAHLVLEINPLTLHFPIGSYRLRQAVSDLSFRSGHHDANHWQSLKLLFPLHLLAAVCPVKEKEVQGDQHCELMSARKGE
jgi:hypothetical protein